VSTFWVSGGDRGAPVGSGCDSCGDIWPTSEAASLENTFYVITFYPPGLPPPPAGGSKVLGDLI